MSIIRTNGIKFKQQFGNIFYIPLTHNNKYLEYCYQLGENIDNPIHLDISVFSYTKGLYFTRLCQVFKDIGLYFNIGIISIPDDAIIYLNNLNNYYRTDKLFIEQIISKSEFINRFPKHSIKHNVEHLQSIKQQTIELCKMAINKSWLAIKWIAPHYLTSQLCYLVVKKYWQSLQYIPKEWHTQELYQIACQQNGTAIQYIDSQTIELCHLAIKTSYIAIKYIKNPTIELYQVAYNRNKRALKYIPDNYQQLINL